MAKPFDTEFFPGGAVGRGNAQVIQDTFDPETAPPVNVTDPSNAHPVDLATEPSVDLSTLIPTLPPENFLGESGLIADDLPEEVWDFFDTF